MARLPSQFRINDKKLILQPTFNLRWKPVQDAERETAMGMLPAKYPTEGDSYFILQQWWEPVIRIGEPREIQPIKGEWRDIKIDWSYTNEPPL